MVIPPLEQIVEGAVFDIEIPIEGFATAAIPRISTELPPHEDSNALEINVQAKIKFTFLIFIKGNLNVNKALLSMNKNLQTPYR